MPETTLAELSLQFPRPGRVETIVLRPAKRGTCIETKETVALADGGLEGDHRRGGKRQVSLIQLEHLQVIGALLGQEPIDPLRLRRNLVISSINLVALKALLPGRRLGVRIGQALIELTGDCEPCSRMEAELGPGGYNAMRGHGGMVGRILEGGPIRTGDPVTAELLPLEIEQLSFL